MTASEAALSLVWATVYIGLAGFFLISAQRLERRGYDLLGLAIAAVGVSGIGEWLLFGSGPGLVSFFGARLTVLSAVVAPAFHTHFVFLYCGRPEARRVAFVSYVLAGAGGLADLAASADVLGKLSVLEYPAQYIAPAHLVSVFIASLFIGHLVLDAFVFGHAVRAGRRNTRWPLLLILFLGPAVAYDVATVITVGHNYFFTEALTWIYGLVIVGGLLTELGGTEGLLKKTTSRLAARTAELEVSYAEIELMHGELTRKQQLAAVGELAAAIAHEVRNPLAIIMNAASGLRRPRISDADRETLLSIVDEESERLNQLVTELLRFARPVNASRAPASLFDICQRVSATAKEGYHVQVVTPPGGQLGPVWVDPALFTLALENLLDNAMQAMPDGGAITISIRNERFDDGLPAAAVDVKDEGVGMQHAELQRAKKPFFTTRPRGTGLGLPIVERIVEAHGGELSLQSEAGQGTTVTMKVPFEEESAPRYAGAKQPTARRRLRSVHPLTAKDRSHE